MEELDTYGREYTAEEWPYGLRCIDCDKRFEEGDRYATRLEGFINELPLTEVICLECALSER